MLRIGKTKDGATFAVRVVPRAAHNAVVGEHEGALKVRLTAPPVEGRANAALEAFLAEVLGIRPAQIRVIAGHTSRQKTVAVTGVTAEEAERLLTSLR